MTLTKWSLPVASLGPVAAGCRRFHYRGGTFVTAIGKLTCTIVADEAARLASPEPLALADRFDGPRIVAASDAVLAVPHPEIVVLGRTRLHGKKGRIGLAVIGTDGRRVVDKELDVVAGSKDDIYGIPIDFDRALGGVGIDDNPLGRPPGQGANLLSPDAPDEVVASLAPIPAGFLRRKKRLDGRTPRELEAEDVELPDGFDWTYFQAAPPDQRVMSLHGTEWIELTGLHVEAAKLRFRLPGFVVAARLYGAEGETTFRLRIEHVAVHPDRDLVELCYRGNVPISHGGAVEALTVAASPPGHEPLFPSRSTLSFSDLPSSPPKEADASFTSTRVVQPGDDPLPPTPFVLGEAGASATPLSSSATPPPRGGTLDLETARKMAREAFGGPGAPFPIGAPRAEKSPSEVPGAPWAGSAPAHVVKPSADLEATMVKQAKRAPPPPRRTPRGSAAVESPPPTPPAVEDTNKVEEAARQRRVEADRQREVERKRFEEEQHQAAERERRLARQAQQNRASEAAELKRGLYGGLKRKP